MLSEDWRGVPAALERAYRPANCVYNNWLDTLAPLLGHADLVIEHVHAMERCDPLDDLAISFGMYAMLLDGRVGEADDWARRRLDQFGHSPDYEWVRILVQMARGDFRDRPELFQPNQLRKLGAPLDVFTHALAGDLETARQRLADYQANGEEFPVIDQLQFLAVLGEREEVNRLATEIDAKPDSSILLLNATVNCMCGALFDLESTPNLARKLTEAGAPWPPRAVIDFPAKGLVSAWAGFRN